MSVSGTGAEVLIGQGDGILSGMRAEGVIAILSTISVDMCADLERLAAQKGISVLDAPVSGEREAALAGTLYSDGRGEVRKPIGRRCQGSSLAA